MDLSTAAHHQQLHHPFSQFPTQSTNPTPTNHSFNSSPDFSSSTIQESESLENMIMTTKTPADSNNSQNQVAEQKKLRPPETEPQQCPRCESTNTKFCYYNNYSLTQPRYFCKACRRYWTKGGTLRNVPVGGGCRKSAKRAASNSPSQFLKRPHTADDHAPNPVFSGVHGYPAGMLTPNFTDFDAGVNNFFGQQAFLQDLHYGNGGGFMFENNSNLCNNYEEILGGNSNSGSVISDDVAALAPYGDVKQERLENAAFWEHPWQNGIVSGEAEAVRDNWNGLYANYSVLGLLNSPALM